jgi:hypothetical protein
MMFQQSIGVGTPAGAMIDYRAYLIDSDGHIEGFEPLVCADDEGAIEQAQRLARERDVELWSGGRLVARLKKTSLDGR